MKARKQAVQGDEPCLAREDALEACPQGSLALPARILAIDSEVAIERPEFRSSIASVVQSPVRKLPFFAPRGAPGLIIRPPCRRHRLRPRRAGRSHGADRFLRFMPAGILSRLGDEPSNRGAERLAIFSRGVLHKSMQPIVQAHCDELLHACLPVMQT